MPPKNSSNIKRKGSLADGVDPFDSDALRPMVFPILNELKKSSGKKL